MEIAAITHGALLGLAYLHSHNMIHRWGCVIPGSKAVCIARFCAENVQCKLLFFKLVDFLFLPVTDFDLLRPHQRRESW